MAGIEHDHLSSRRLAILPGLVGLVLGRWRRAIRLGSRTRHGIGALLGNFGVRASGVAVEAGEGRPVGRHQVDHHARRLAVAWIDQEGLLDQCRTGEIHDDAGMLLADATIAIGADQSPPRRSDSAGQPEADVRQIDDGAERVGQDIDVKAHRLVEVGDEAGSHLVAGNSGGNHRRRAGGTSGSGEHGRKRCQGCHHRQEAQEKQRAWYPLPPELPCPAAIPPIGQKQARSREGRVRMVNSW